MGWAGNTLVNNSELNVATGGLPISEPLGLAVPELELNIIKGMAKFYRLQPQDWRTISLPLRITWLTERAGSLIRLRSNSAAVWPIS